MDSQLKKGALELIVLASLAHEPAYGGALLDRLTATGLALSAGTLYPLLTRMKKTGHITSHWEESPSGPPRKVYSLTPAGRARAHHLASQWRALASIVDTHLKGL
ncbi:PadR family transcriptional regulator [Actinomyces sp. B33]|uniref:PadR family transcriptional regulator n=1 Tax=Actinomyces sp. B33 TaxID=2942131 RepID=UPI0023406141|nr:PadR family transcriptional regulator [Actinomyces sp. B33]MDC4232792.1 PadR family transcriptional regulator [Actinomyces sp. B33]